MVTRAEQPVVAALGMIFRLAEGALGSALDLTGITLSQPTLVGATLFAIPRALAWTGVVGSVIVVVGLPLQLAGLLGAPLTMLMWMPTGERIPARRSVRSGVEFALRLSRTSSMEGMMPIVVVFQSPTLTQQKYEESVRRLTGGKRSRMESLADWPVEGLLLHAAGQGEKGFRVVDVWTSQEAFQRFGEKLMPILQAVGVEGNPDIYPAHAFVSA